MQFSYFTHVWAKPGMTPHQRYEQLWRELELCDEVGFDHAFCVEHHFRPDESWMSAPSLFSVGAGVKTRNLRIGPMGYIPALYDPLRLVEEIAIVDQMLGGRMELGLVPGINPAYFEPFGASHEDRKSPTLEFVKYLRAAFGEDQPFSYDGDNFETKSANLSVLPMQRPHPPLWMQSRDPETLEFCAREGINTGYFLVFPHEEAGPVYRKYIDDWHKAGWSRKPKIAHSTVVYVDETDEKAMEIARHRAARAYEGFLPPRKEGESFEDLLERYTAPYIERGDLKSIQTRLNLFNADYIFEHDIMFVGSPETVAGKLRAASEISLFNTFMGEFNFADLPEDDLMRSIRLFAEEVIPELRDFEPF